MVNNEQAAFLSEWQEDLDRISLVMKSVREKSAEISNRGVDQSYAKIEKAAMKLVRKDRSLTQDAAVARLLQTPEGQRLYAEYEAEFGLRQRIEAVTERNMLRRIDKQVDDREALLDLYARTADEQAALDSRRQAERFVQKADEDAYGPIRRAASRIMEADPSLAREDAELLAIEQDPSLYDDYVAKQQQALNTSSVDSPGGLFGEDDFGRSGGELS